MADQSKLSFLSNDSAEELRKFLTDRMTEWEATRSPHPSMSSSSNHNTVLKSFLDEQHKMTEPSKLGLHSPTTVPSEPDQPVIQAPLCQLCVEQSNTSWGKSLFPQTLYLTFNLPEKDTHFSFSGLRVKDFHLGLLLTQYASQYVANEIEDGGYTKCLDIGDTYYSWNRSGGWHLWHSPETLCALPGIPGEPSTLLLLWEIDTVADRRKVEGVLQNVGMKKTSAHEESGNRKLPGKYGASWTEDALKKLKMLRLIALEDDKTVAEILKVARAAALTAPEAVELGLVAFEKGNNEKGKHQCADAVEAGKTRGLRVRFKLPPSDNAAHTTEQDSEN